MKTGLAYYRVSSAMQREKFSIDRQKKLLPALGKKLNVKIVKEYEDNGLSGKSIVQRPGLSGLLADLKKTDVDYILFLHPSRLARPQDISTMLELLTALNTAKVNVGYLRQDDWTGEMKECVVPYGDMVAFRGLFDELTRAAEENRHHSFKVRGGKFNNLLEGRWPFPNAPYGFQWDRQTQKFIAMTDQIATLKWLFEQVAAGRGSPALASELRRRRVLTPKAANSEKYRLTAARNTQGGEYRWRQYSIRFLVGNSSYCTGLLRHNMESRYGPLLKNLDPADRASLTQDNHVEFPLLVNGQPVVSKKLFDKAHKVVAAKGISNRGGNRRSEDRHFLFGPWLSCGCGSRYTTKTHRLKTKDDNRYYLCRSHRSEAQREGLEYCSVPLLNADQVDAKLWNMVFEFLTKPTTIVADWLTRQEKETKNPDDLKRRLAQHEKDIATHEAAKARLLDLYTDGVVERKVLNSRTAKEQGEIARLQDETKAIKACLESVEAKTGGVSAVRKDLKQFERSIKKYHDEIKQELDALPWNQKRLFLQRLFGDTKITVSHLDPLRWRAKIRRWYKSRDEGDREWQRFVKLHWLDAEKEAMVSGLILPFKPLEILDSLQGVGIQISKIKKSTMACTFAPRIAGGFRRV